METDQASRYLQQVCKHWSHNLAVEFDERRGRIVFPRDARGAAWPDDGVVTLVAEADGLRCLVEASAPGQRDGLKDALARHFDRFAFREGALDFAWQQEMS